jgi:hypothetical protein
LGHRHPRALVARLSAWVIALGLGVASFPATAHAADLRVPTDFPTIQAALDAAASGDTVLVMPGTYAENLDFHGKDIHLESTDGAAVTTLAVPGGTGVAIGPRGAFVGFTVTGASGSFGAAMAVSGVGTVVRHDVFDGNAQGGGGFGAAIGGNGASPLIDQNVFRHNSCDDQFLSGVVAFVNSSSPVITNNLFEHNACRAIDMTLPTGNTPQVIGNTMVDNPVGVHVDGRVTAVQQVYRDNILVGNQVGLEVVFGAAGRNPTWENNLVFGSATNYTGIDDQTGLAGNVSMDPAFVDAVHDDYHLQFGSPAIDAGSSAGAPTADFDGVPRPLDGNGDGLAAFDMGAFEFPRLVGIDIEPGRTQNRVEAGHGDVPVAILSAASFNAPAQVDRTSLTFGRTGHEVSLVRCDPHGVDVNRDGLPDLLCVFSVGAAGFQPGDTAGILDGRTSDGAPLTGRDQVTVRQ